MTAQKRTHEFFCIQAMIRPSLIVLRRRLVPAVQKTGHGRQLHRSMPVKFINPLLPFDVLEDLQNEDLEEANKKLKKEKKKIIKEKKNIEKRLENDEESGENPKEESKENSAENSKEHSTDSPQSESGGGSNPNLNGDRKVTETRKVGEDYSTLNSSNVVDGIYIKNVELLKYSIATPHGLSAAAGGVSKSASGLPSAAGASSPGGNNDENNTEQQRKEERKKEDEEAEEEAEEESHSFKETMDKFLRFFFKCLETMGITLSSIAMLGSCGIFYHKYYNVHVLEKIDKVFDVGDPAYQLSVHRKTSKHTEHEDGHSCDLSQFWAQRPQQALLDDIISGKIVGRYFLVIGEKGTGKTSLLLESMKKVDGYNVAIFDAHADPEIFRLRLGKALNFAYNEDYIGSLFSMRGPRDTTALLDIERAFGKLEELALQRINKTKGKPLVLIINNSHLIKDNEDGVKLIELLQQKSESLSGSGLATIIFNSDDYWVYEKLKKLGTRLEVINVRDFGRREAIVALKFTREKNFPSHLYPDLVLKDDICHQVYDLIGGRPQHIAQVARHRDVFKASHEIIDREKTWFLNQCGLLGLDMDDDVMESGKFSTLAMLLMKTFVDMDRHRFNTLLSQEHPDKKDEAKDHSLPELPLWRARQIMTRADYIQQYDNLNIFTIDSESRVRADSVPMMRAFHEIASQPQFAELLEDTIERVAQIESLGRTREIVAKDLIEGNHYTIKKLKDEHKYSIMLHKNTSDDEEHDEEDLLMEDITRSGHKAWWKKRMQSFDKSYSPPKKVDYDIDINRH